MQAVGGHMREAGMTDQHGIAVLDRLAMKDDLAMADMSQARDDLGQFGLPVAIDADYSHDLSRANVEADALERRDHLVGRGAGRRMRAGILRHCGCDGRIQPDHPGCRRQLAAARFAGSSFR